MIDITVVENGVAYECFVDEDDIYMYIDKSKNIMNCLDDEQKILEVIYEIWLEDKSFLRCLGSDIPENSPHYGERWYNIENISLDDIKWNSDEAASKVINRSQLRAECATVIAEELEIDSCYVGIDIIGNFYIGTNDALLYFYNKDLSFKDGDFSGKYRIKKNRSELLDTVQKAIIKNEKLIRGFLQC